MIEQKLVTCEPDDPHRCQAKGMQNEGQCKFLAVEGQIHCSCHGGSRTARADEKRACHDYRLQVWQQRLNEFSESENVKNLRGEIAILRLLVEEIINRCQSSNDLMLYSGKIGDLVAKIERVATTCDRFETKVGMMLDKSAAIVLAGQIVDVISKEITDPLAIDRISNGIITIIGNIGNNVGGIGESDSTAN